MARLTIVAVGRRGRCCARIGPEVLASHRVSDPDPPGPFGKGGHRGSVGGIGLRGEQSCDPRGRDDRFDFRASTRRTTAKAGTTQSPGHRGAAQRGAAVWRSAGGRATSRRHFLPLLIIAIWRKSAARAAHAEVEQPTNDCQPISAQRWTGKITSLAEPRRAADGSLRISSLARWRREQVGPTR